MRSGCLFALGMLIWHALDMTEPRRWRPILAFGLCGFISVFVRARTLSLEEGATTTSLLVPALLWLTTILLLAGAVVWNRRITVLIGRYGAAVRTWTDDLPRST